ncbi:MAG TPA: hypothetical protein VFF53_01645 [Geobacteraceae bacterium]|nr:hypothetical protein [Geobacteraceae bacterium]
MSGRERPKIQLVRNRKDHAVVGAVRLSIVSPRTAPLCDAVVLEEDTWQVVAAGSVFSLCNEHPIRVWTEALNSKPLKVGTVLLREGCPLTMVAVVYDFDAVQCCRSRWITAALAEIFRNCGERHVRSLLLPLPGIRHGRLSPRKALRLVIKTLKDVAHGGLHTVLLECSSEDVEEKVRHLLAAETDLKVTVQKQEDNSPV